MVRGIATFKCPKCGKVFEGPDMEWNATALTAPLPCPECGHPECHARKPMDWLMSKIMRFFE